MTIPVSVECGACGAVNETFSIPEKTSIPSSFHCRFCGWTLTRPVHERGKEEAEDGHMTERSHVRQSQFSHQRVGGRNT
jgi:ribosomal protein S27E